jgi:DNA helicase-2/ATP-dependent DNA helicase PcrA
MQLNPEQEEVANHFKGRSLVLAGPGSGKTRTITERIGRLLAAGVPAYKILCITFTNKTANEMKDRIEKGYGDVAKKMTVCTFHSLCVRILTEFGSAFGYNRNLTIYDQDDQLEQMMSVARSKLATNEKADDTDKEIRHRIKKLCSVCDSWRESLEPESVLSDMVDGSRLQDGDLEVIRDYLKKLRASNAIDFSGLLYETYRLLKSDLEVRERLQHRWEFIQVDEFQDTNVAQHEIVEMLSGEDDNIVAIGDLDQSIYTWRGASPDNVKRFQARSRSAFTKHTLGTNYRSTPEIIAVSDKLIRCSEDRTEIKFVAANPSIGQPPTLAAYHNPVFEANGIIEQIKEYLRSGYAAKEIAIFYRLNSMSRVLEHALMANSIPYKIIGGMGFYDRAEVKDCMAMLRLLVNPSDAASFNRLCKRLGFGIGEKTLGIIENHAKESGESIISSCGKAEEYMSAKSKVADTVKVHNYFHFDASGKKPAELLLEVLTRIDYKKWQKDHITDGSLEERQGNVGELLNGISEYTDKHAGSGLPEYLQYIALLTSADEESDEAVNLMTIHSSKGLEFDVVFMPGVEHTLLPHERAVRERPEYGHAEERRLCYVGFTRAKKMLRVSWCAKRLEGFGPNAKEKLMRPSSFLLEAGLISEEDFNQATTNLLNGRSREQAADDFDDQDVNGPPKKQVGRPRFGGARSSRSRRP